jgi:hypothetical protein
MTSSEPSASAANRPADLQASGASTLPGVLADAARALADAPADADDAAILAILGQAVVPALGDAVALYAADAAGTFLLVAATPGDAPPAQRHGECTGQHEIAASLGADPRRDGLLVVGSTDPARRYDDADRSAAEVLAAIVGARRAARRQTECAATLRQQIDALALAGRELAHLLNNDLTLPVGVVELLLDRNTLTPDLQEMLQAAAKDLVALEQHVRAFHDLMREQSSRLGA